MPHSKRKIVQHVAGLVRKKFQGEGTGHDWYHIERVWKNAKSIAAKEKKADIFVVELGALLHDIADWKFHGSKAGPKAAANILQSLKLPNEIIDQVTYMVDRVSFKGGTEKRKMETLEGQIVQDADRLDTLGAIGIARAFAMGGYWQRPLYDPKIKPKKFKTIAAYKKHKGTTVNHFYEKVLLVRERMNTKAGKQMALDRHKFLENYLKQFFAEWEGKK